MLVDFLPRIFVHHPIRIWFVDELFFKEYNYKRSTTNKSVQSPDNQNRIADKSITLHFDIVFLLFKT